MNVSKAEALDILKSWQQENQRIGYLIEVVPDSILVKGAGRITEVSEELLHIEAECLKDSPKEMFFVEIPLPREEAGYTYSEAREFEKAEVLQEMEPAAAHDSSLIITIPAMGLRFVLGSFLSLRQ